MEAYGTDSGFEAWLAAQGMVLPTGADVSILRQIGSNYIDAAYEARLSCSQRTGGFTQLLAWPRTGHRVNGQDVPSDLIPQAWINASYRAAYLEAMNPGWTTSGGDPSRMTQRERVDVIERAFFAPSEVPGSGDIAPGSPFDATINALVTPWLCSDVRSINSLMMVV